MSKIIIPIAEAEPGGSLKDLYYKLAVIRTDIKKSTTDTEAIIEGLFKLSIAEVNSILVAGGEVYGYLMAIRAPKALFNAVVPDGLPNRLTFNGASKTFDSWLVPGAEVWLKDDDTEIILFTNPFAGNEASYLTGTEIKIIHSMPGVVAITVSSANAETAIGWTKL